MTGTSIIDHQAHWYPKALLEALAGRDGYPTLPALKMALDVYGADRITLGSDVPYVSRERHLNFLREHLPAEQVGRILTNRLPGLVD